MAGTGWKEEKVKITCRRGMERGVVITYDSWKEKGQKTESKFSKKRCSGHNLIYLCHGM